MQENLSLQDRRQSWARRSSLIAFALLLGCGEESESPEPSETIDAASESGADQTRFRRLTHSEWKSTVLDLLRVEPEDELGAEVVLLADRLPGVTGKGDFLFEGKADALEVDGILAGAYARTAQRLAELATNDEARLNELLPRDDGSNTQKATEFIRLFGARMFRRALETQEIESYLELFELGLDAFYPDSGDLDADERTSAELRGGIRLLLEAFFQSPDFVYRVETREGEADEDGVAPLSGFERAVRLSYFLLGTSPDDELIQAAFDGELDTLEGVTQEAERMAKDERARGQLFSFFSQVLEIDGYESKISPSSNKYPDLSEDFPEFAFKEAKAFIEFEFFDQKAPLSELFSSQTAYINPDLAEIYGTTVEGSGFYKVELGAERAGFFTRTGFLASQATSIDPDPIHRGVFFAKRLSCLPLNPPPANIPQLTAPDGQTNREYVEELTEQDGTACKACHERIINPFGFALEGFDAIGQSRTEDHGFPVDTTTEVLVDDESLPVEGATDMTLAMAQSRAVHECIASHLISFAHGREVEEVDDPLIERLAAISLDEEAPFMDLFVELAVSNSFLFRPASEESANEN